MWKDIDLENHIVLLNNSKILIVVEGKRDKQALRNLGIKAPILTLFPGIYKIIEEICYEYENYEVCILTDLDRAGKHLYSRLYSELCNYGIKINNTFREYIFTSTKVRQIEGLFNYAKRNKLVRGLSFEII